MTLKKSQRMREIMMLLRRKRSLWILSLSQLTNLNKETCSKVKHWNYHYQKKKNPRELDNSLVKEDKLFLPRLKKAKRMSISMMMILSILKRKRHLLLMKMWWVNQTLDNLKVLILDFQMMKITMKNQKKRKKNQV